MRSESGKHAHPGGVAVALLQLAFGEFDPPANPPRSAVRAFSPSDEALGTATAETTRALDPGGPTDQSKQGGRLLFKLHAKAEFRNVPVSGRILA